MRATETPAQTAGNKAGGCYWRVRRHLHSHRRWGRRAFVLRAFTGIIGVVTGTALVANLAAESTAAAITVGLFGIAAGVLTVLDRELGAQQKETEHREAAAAFLVMRGKYRAFEANPPADLAVAREQLAQFEVEHSKLDAETIPPEEWTQAVIDHERAGKKSHS